MAEQRLNQAGYRLIRVKEFPKAIAILQLNTELYPASANTYDSLAEAYMTVAGDKEKAIAFYRKSMQVIDADPKAAPEQKTAMKANAIAKLKELGATP